MKVGSLDMLMALSDELARADSYAETVVRKVERQIVDSHLAGRSASDERRGDATPAPLAPAPFLVDGLGVHEYIKRFAWDSEQFDAKVRPRMWRHCASRLGQCPGPSDNRLPSCLRRCRRSHCPSS